MARRLVVIRHHSMPDLSHLQDQPEVNLSLGQIVDDLDPDFIFDELMQTMASEPQEENLIPEETDEGIYINCTRPMTTDQACAAFGRN